ncbi:MAG: hypothetical protein DHS20C15_16850 [Planctomycetota bacterium]|nr:MAG: hypothetical protein DHS20C15_16850 [Planctomycetota bacterium]
MPVPNSQALEVASHESQGSPAQEAVGAEILDARLQRNRDTDEHFSAQASAALIAGLARAVQARHDMGVVQVALHPSVVVLHEGHAPVLLDAGPEHAQQPVLSSGRDAAGGDSACVTARYTAPEQARGAAPSVRGDVYSLGAMLYELLGHRPPRSRGNAAEVLRAARTHPLPPLRSTSRALPKSLRHVVERATSFRAARRYASPAELAEDLEACVAGTAVSARPAGLVERLDNSCLRHRRAWILLGAVLLVGAAVWVLSRLTS